MAPLIAYIRLHHFYALLEAKRDLCLWQQPFVVTRAQKIIDVSPKAAAKHITTAMGLRQARLACPNLRVVEAKAHPLPAAERFWDVCAALSPLVEPESYNSAFFDLSGLGSLETISEGILRQLHWRLEFPFCVGIAPNKLVAKIAYWEVTNTSLPSPGQKPLTWHRGRGQNAYPVKLQVSPGKTTTKGNNYLVIPPQDVEDFLASLPVSRLWLWPDRIHQQLYNLGIYTIGQLREVPKVQLQKQLGQVGEQLYDAARGIDRTTVQNLYPPEAVQSYFQLPPETDGCKSWEALAVHLLPLLQNAAAGLQAKAKACSRLQLFVQYDGLPQRCWDKSLKNVIQTANQLLQVVRELLTREAWPAPITGIRLMLMGLRPALGQLTFSPQVFGAQRQRQLQQVLSSLQARFGTDRIFVAKDISIPRRERMLQLLVNYH